MEEDLFAERSKTKVFRVKGWKNYEGALEGQEAEEEGPIKAGRLSDAASIIIIISIQPWPGKHHKSMTTWIWDTSALIFGAYLFLSKAVQFNKSQLRCGLGAGLPTE